MKLKSLFFLTTIMICYSTQAQLESVKTQTTDVQCGNQISQEFGGTLEHHEFKIKLEAGDQLSIDVIPTGDNLNMRTEIYDLQYNNTKRSPGRIFPEGNIYTYREPMFTDKMRSLKVSTGKVSSNGIYTIIIFNNYKKYRKDARSGEYTIRFTCIKKDGSVIEPG